MVLFIVLQGVRVRLGLRAGGGRATGAVQGHCCGLWAMSEGRDDEVALRSGQFDSLACSRGEHRQGKGWKDVC